MHVANTFKYAKKTIKNGPPLPQPKSKQQGVFSRVTNIDTVAASDGLRQGELSFWPRRPVLDPFWGEGVAFRQSFRPTQFCERQ